MKLSLLSYNRSEFLRVFPPKFKDKLKESIIPFKEKLIAKNIANGLYRDLADFKYHPSPPRDYIVFNKHNYVSRIVTSFHAKDYFLTYFCCKMLEEEIAKNRVPGTYGGWRLGNKIRIREEEEDIFFDYENSISFNSYNPYLWRKNWQNFQKKAYQFSISGKYSFFLKFDIANFYNDINLDILYKKLLSATPKQKVQYVELLFHFLKNWNKKFEGFSTKTVGLPQDEIGDCSRLLANFYLQDYDDFMSKFCKRLGAKYLRYADDQIMFTDKRETALEILFAASKELFKIGLDINSSKVDEFKCKNDFNTYWAFEIFELLKDEKDLPSINKAFKMFLSYRKRGVRFRESSILKRLLGVDFTILKPVYKKQFFTYILEPEFLSNLEWWGLNKIYMKLKPKAKINFLRTLDELIDKVNFNSFHYNLRYFYKKNKIEYDERRLNDRINKLRI
jgi:hypothetical protein